MHYILQFCMHKPQYLQKGITRDISNPLSEYDFQNRNIFLDDFPEHKKNQTNCTLRNAKKITSLIRISQLSHANESERDYFSHEICVQRKTRLKNLSRMQRGTSSSSKSERKTAEISMPYGRGKNKKNNANGLSLSLSLSPSHGLTYFATSYTHARTHARSHARLGSFLTY